MEQQSACDHQAAKATVMHGTLTPPWKDWCWSSDTLATWYEELTHRKRLWCWERLRAQGDYGWDDWMASLIQLKWTWAGSKRWWGTGEPGVLQFMQSQRVGPDWTTANAPLHLPYWQTVRVLWTFFHERFPGLWKSPRWPPIVLPPGIQFILVSLLTKTVKHLPAMRETLVRSLSQEDPLEKEMATHSSTLAWNLPWTEDPGRLQSTGSQRVGHDWVTSLSFLYSYHSITISHIKLGLT